MKEATGEANMTIITVVLIGIITVVAVPIITNLIKSTENRACCVNNGYTFSGGNCYSGGSFDETGKYTGGTKVEMKSLDCKG